MPKKLAQQTRIYFVIAEAVVKATCVEAIISRPILRVSAYISFICLEHE